MQRWQWWQQRDNVPAARRVWDASRKPPRRLRRRVRTASHGARTRPSYGPLRPRPSSRGAAEQQPCTETETAKCDSQRSGRRSGHVRLMWQAVGPELLTSVAWSGVRVESQPEPGAPAQSTCAGCRG